MSRVVQLARDLGLVVHHHYDARRSAPGWPDLCIVDPRPLGYVGPQGEEMAIAMPEVLLIETKTATGKLTREQELWLRALDGKRVRAEVWRPAQFEAIVARLKGEQP
mgnify:CR=1 FL=1